MKPLNIKISLLSLIIIIGLSSCGGGSTEEKITDTTPTATEPTKVDGVSRANESSGFYYINDKSNVNLAEINIEAGEIVLSTKQGNLFGELKNDKRKYYSQNNDFKYAVKFKEDGFKLRDQNESLLWKVKLYDDKIKIASNEEMNDALTVRLYDENKIKLKKDDEELAAVRLMASDPFLEVGNYVVRNFGSSLSLGVLMIEDMPDEHKFLICTELLNMER